MKKPVQTLRLNRETVAQLDRPSLEKVGGAVLTNGPLCNSANSCGHICP